MAKNGVFVILTVCLTVCCYTSPSKIDGSTPILNDVYFQNSTIGTAASTQRSIKWRMIFNSDPSIQYSSEITSNNTFLPINNSTGWTDPMKSDQYSKENTSIYTYISNHNGTGFYTYLPMKNSTEQLVSMKTNSSSLDDVKTDNTNPYRSNNLKLFIYIIIIIMLIIAFIIVIYKKFYSTIFYSTLLLCYSCFTN